MRSLLPGISLLWDQTLGDPEIRVAVLDGPVDLAHPCFQGADLRRVATLVNDPAGTGPMSVHGTHVTSVIFGQPSGPVTGIAPRCQGLILPVFRENQKSPLSQLDLARAIEQAVQAGAHVINISGGQRSQEGGANAILERAIRLCADNRVLVVAAAGNDGCECLHVPAALPSVLAVGAMGEDGEPLEISNWGEAYQSKGVLAPGQNILGAVPGGGTARLTGSSFAAPIVSGVAALLLSIERRNGRKADPLAVGEIILKSAEPCNPRGAPECRRYLVGSLDIPGAYALINEGEKKTMANSEETQVGSQSAAAAPALAETGARGTTGAGQVGAGTESSGRPPATVAIAHPVGTSGSRAASAPVTGVTASCGCQDGTQSYVFVVGNVSFDFGTEARRDSFRQLMPNVVVTKPDGTTVSLPPNPYDTKQLLDYLNANPWESTKLIWILNLDLTPIYALEAETPYAEEVYKGLRSALAGESLPSTDINWVSRVSVSGVLTNRTVKLFSGQTVPVVRAQARGLYSWNQNQLIQQAIDAVAATQPAGATGYATAALTALRNFLDYVYYQLRNLGQASSDRALNYTATNVFAAVEGIAKAMNPASFGVVTPVAGQTGIYTLGSISVSQSPFCRMDSDCWDVQLTFFDPENSNRANVALQMTVDVSDEMPVSLAPTRFFVVAGS
jgi:cyanobactin maturation PatA/PatG family protease